MSETRKYRKKPVAIDAIQWTGDNLLDIIAFTGRHPSAAGWSWEHFEEVVKRDGLIIFTLEGKHLASVGDYIIRGVKGEFYPCKPDIFAATYEPAAPVERGEPDKVREALVKALYASTPGHSEYQALSKALGLNDPSPRELADALLALRAAPSGEAEPWCWIVQSGATLRAALGAAFSEQDADRLLALADTEDARATLGPSRLVPLYAHPAAPLDGPQVT